MWIQFCFWPICIMSQMINTCILALGIQMNAFEYKCLSNLVKYWLEFVSDPLTKRMLGSRHFRIRNAVSIRQWQKFQRKPNKILSRTKNRPTYWIYIYHLVADFSFKARATKLNSYRWKENLNTLLQWSSRQRTQLMEIVIKFFIFSVEYRIALWL